MADVTQEELVEINNLRTKLATVVTESGQVNLQIQLMESELAELKSKTQEQLKFFKVLLEEEQKLVNRLSDKYGAGSINFETGEFTSK